MGDNVKTLNAEINNKLDMLNVGNLKKVDAYLDNVDEMKRELKEDINRKLEKLAGQELARLNELLDEMIKKDNEPAEDTKALDGLHNLQDNIMLVDYSYLKGLSQSTQNLIISGVREGKKNLYHSVMAVLNNRIKSNRLEDADTEAMRYIQKYSIPEERQGNIKELIKFCYGRIEERRGVKEEPKSKRNKIKVPNWNNYK